MVTTTPLVRARAGDEDAFRELTGPYLRELQAHCYRMLGSVQDAEDVLQETLLAAWRGLGQFEERASMRTWLYKIATNRCLNTLRDATRRPQIATVPNAPDPTRLSEPLWLQPYPDTLATDLPDTAPGPEARYESREALALAFVTGLQRLAPRQRAVLVLRDVLGYPAGETARILEITEVAANSALQRARGVLAAQLPAADRETAPAPRSARERELTTRFAEAFEAADTKRLVTLLTDDALMTMPPLPLEYQGGAAIAEFYESRGWWRRVRIRLAPIWANGQPGFAYYLAEPGASVASLHGLLVLTLRGDAIAAITRFEAAGLLPYLQVPPELPA
jgi:RNA polymerase sigma-70 factor (ECF subfamily)